MNKKVFYKDGTIIEVERGNSYLKRQIKINQYYAEIISGKGDYIL